MDPMLAYALVVIAESFLPALGVTLPLFGVSVLASRIRLRRDLREFAGFPCPGCATPIGIAAARAGEDVSPVEEIWSNDEKTKDWHCHPTCRRVRCGDRSTVFVVRLNRSGSKCGPRLSVERNSGEPEAR